MSRFAAPLRGSSEQIADELRRHISRQRLRPGDRLGTEGELAAEFGVSRPTLREALRLLAGSHLVRATRGPGGGIFVASTPNEGLSRNLSESIAAMVETDRIALDELVEARIYLEVPLAGLAARRATAETVAELIAAQQEAEGHDAASDAFRVADARFHRSIAATAGNELLLAFTSWAFDVLQPLLVRSVGHAVDGDRILRQHRDIARAIERGQPAAAERAMRRHLEYVLEVVNAVGGAAARLDSTDAQRARSR